MGGPGVVFWIWVSAIFASVLKYAETVLAIHYRRRDKNGEPCGGAYYYIKSGLKAPAVATLFCAVCVFTSFTMGCITQTKAAADGVFISSGVSPVVCGTVFFVNRKKRSAVR
jgi:AGCS family alanine or glycine:cation symporter